MPTPSRFVSGVQEFDRALGGGLMPGSVVLIGGDPGIGKSTLLLQMTAQIAQTQPCLYVTGEESAHQVRMRAERLNLKTHDLHLVAATNLEAIIAFLETSQTSVCIIDSIQTMAHHALEQAPGTVNQMRGCTQALVRCAKERNLAVILVGHVTKDGQIAGPRAVEHMVDAVLYFEGDAQHPFRLLRGVKNRFGPTDEIGVFDMTDQGLREVSNPSELFLAGREAHGPGTVIFAGVQGHRAMLMEIQALVAPSPLSTPRRTAVGWDTYRLAMILAVLETRCGTPFAHKDVYLNIVGGLRIQEPAADLAVAAALLSSLTGHPWPDSLVAFGEIGLGGEIRPVQHGQLRTREALRLGLSSMLVHPKNQDQACPKTHAITSIRALPDLCQRPGTTGLVHD